MTQKHSTHGGAEDPAKADTQGTLSYDSIKRLVHDINNPLTLMLFNLEELRRTCEEREDGHASVSLVDEIIEAAARIEELVRSLLDSVGSPSPRPAAVLPHESGPAIPLATRVLVVDDEAKLLQAIGRILSRDHLVRCCTNASEALECLDQETYDVILSDVVMPEVSGIEFRKRVLARNSRYQKRFLFMTGGPLGEGQNLEGEVVRKPFTKAGILDAIRSILRQASD